MAVYALVWLSVACSSTKHVPDGQYLLDNVKLEVTERNDVNTTELYNFLRQTPNHKVLGFAKLQLSTYSLSGRDSTKWYNRWLRRIGQPPVIYNNNLTDASCRQLRLALVNSGYLDANVEADTASNGKRMDLRYVITAGEPHVVSTVNYHFEDSAIRDIVLADTAASLLHPGMLLDRTELDAERARITRRLRDAG